MVAKVFKSGESVTAEFMTELSQSVSNAELNSVNAKDVSNTAQVASRSAKNNSEQALTKADEALTDSDFAKQTSLNANAAAQAALSEVGQLKEKIESGELNGKDGVLVKESGFFTFAVEDGQLCVYYAGEVPDMQLDEETGELIYNY